MAMPSKLDQDPELARQLVEEYRLGVRLHILACRHHVGWSALRRTIVAHGVEIRPPCKNLRTTPSGRRSRRGPLTAEQIEQLRLMIGFKPAWLSEPDD